MQLWREYEHEIFELLRKKADPDARVEFDVRLPGKVGIDRQIDIYVEGLFAGGVLPNPATLAVDCKCWSSTVDVTDVERFIGLVEDVGTDFGLMITTEGFSKAATARAAGHRGVQIDVITFEELEAWRPNVELCEVCEVDPESDSMPGMMYVERLAPDGEPIEERILSVNATVAKRSMCSALAGRSTASSRAPRVMLLNATAAGELSASIRPSLIAAQSRSMTIHISEFK